MTSPSADFWLASDDSGFVRGDICFYSEVVPAHKDFLSAWELRVLWNSSQVVNSSVEKWTRVNAESESRVYLVQHTNRIAGAEYLIIRGSLIAMAELFEFLGGNQNFSPWDSALDPIEEALSDVRKSLGRKWLLEDSFLDRSMKVVNCGVS